jgi:hypothetical protein
MLMSSRALIGTLLAIVVLGAAVTAAPADIVLVEPAGSVVMNSVGRLTVTTEVVEVACSVALGGMLAEEATGHFTEEPDPEENPLIGAIDDGSASGCLFGTTVSLLIPEDWPIYVVDAVEESEDVSMYVEDVRFLMNVLFGVLRCLARLGVQLTYDASGAEAVITATTVLSTTALSGNCPTEIALVGEFALDPAQGIAATKLLTCRIRGEADTTGSVLFGEVTPGEAGVRHLVCKNTSGGELAFGERSGIVETRFPESRPDWFRAHDLPARESRLAADRELTIRLEYLPSRDAGLGRSHDARLQIDTGLALAFINLLGRTPNP